MGLKYTMILLLVPGCLKMRVDKNRLAGWVYVSSPPQP